MIATHCLAHDDTLQQFQQPDHKLKQSMMNIFDNTAFLRRCVLVVIAICLVTYPLSDCTVRRRIFLDKYGLLHPPVHNVHLMTNVVDSATLLGSTQLSDLPTTDSPVVVSTQHLQHNILQQRSQVKSLNSNDNSNNAHSRLAYLELLIENERIRLTEQEQHVVDGEESRMLKLVTTVHDVVLWAYAQSVDRVLAHLFMNGPRDRFGFHEGDDPEEICKSYNKDIKTAMWLQNRAGRDECNRILFAKYNSFVTSLQWLGLLCWLAWILFTQVLILRWSTLIPTSLAPISAPPAAVSHTYHHAASFSPVMSGSATIPTTGNENHLISTITRQPHNPVTNSEARSKIEMTEPTPAPTITSARPSNNLHARAMITPRFNVNVTSRAEQLLRDDWSKRILLQPATNTHSVPLQSKPASKSKGTNHQRRPFSMM